MNGASHSLKSSTRTLALAACLWFTSAACPAGGPDADPPGAPVVEPSKHNESGTPRASAADNKSLFPSTFTPTPVKNVPRTGAVKPETPTGTLSGVLVPLAVVVAVILIGASIFRSVMRRGGGGALMAMLGAAGRAPSGILEVLGRYPVARGQTLILLKLDQRVLLVAQTHPTRQHAGSFNTLAELTDAADVASILMKVSETEQSGPAGKFNSLLRQYDAETEAGTRVNTSPLRRVTAALRDRVHARPTNWVEPAGPVEEIELPTPAGDDGLRSLRATLHAMRSPATLRAGGKR